MRKFWTDGRKAFALLWAAPMLAMMSFFLFQVLRDHNYLEIFPLELLFPTFQHALTALIIAWVLYRVKRPKVLAAKVTAATLLGLLMVGYDGRLLSMQSALRPFLPFTPGAGPDLTLLTLGFLALLFWLAVQLGRALERLMERRPDVQPANVMMGVFVLLGVIFVGEAYGLAQALPGMITQSRVKLPELPAPKSEPSKDKPDVYYIVMDRYTNDEVLKEQFNYDNTGFTGFLEERGFTVNRGAYANYPYTAISVASTINGMHLKDAVAPYKNGAVQSHTLFENLIRQSAVIKAMKDAGYEYHSIGSWYGASNYAPLATKDYAADHQLQIFGMDVKRLRGIEIIDFGESPWYRLVNVNLPWWPIAIREIDQQLAPLTQLQHLEDLANEKPGGRFIFAHMLIPHDPFVFNADGSRSNNTSTDNYGKPIKEKFTGQTTYINSEMRKLVERIQAKSAGKAVILLNSDEGPYPWVMNSTLREPAPESANDSYGVVKGDMSKWSDDWLRMKFGILQAAYIPGMTEEEKQNLNSVNLFRIVLNRNFGYELPYLPDCQFGLNLGSHLEFSYVDITRRLKGDAPAECKRLESVSGRRQ